MKVIYIRESGRLESFLDRIMFRTKCFFNLVDRKETDGKIMYYLPIVESRNISNFRAKRIYNRINKMLDKDESNIAVLSKYLSSITLLKNYLYSNNIDILSGRILFKCLSYHIIEYIFKCWNIETELGEVTILVNDFNDINKEIIIFIAKRTKTLNIVTNHIDRFKKIEEYLYNEYGIILNLSNNRRKSLLKSRLILNLDFPEELVNKYRIYDEAVLINLLDKVNIKSKRFNGINVNSYRIKKPSKFKASGFYDEVVYESLIYKLNSFERIYERISKDKIELSSLIGNNGVISKFNFKKMAKTIDKTTIKE